MINKFIVKIIGCQQYRLKQFLTMFYSLVNVTDWCLSPLKSSCSFNVLWKLILYWTFIWNLNYITSVCYANILGFIISITKYIAPKYFTKYTYSPCNAHFGSWKNPVIYMLHKFEWYNSLNQFHMLSTLLNNSKYF